MTTILINVQYVLVAFFDIPTASLDPSVVLEPIYIRLNEFACFNWIILNDETLRVPTLHLILLNIFLK